MQVTATSHWIRLCRIDVLATASNSRQCRLRDMLHDLVISSFTKFIHEDGLVELNRLYYGGNFELLLSTAY